MEAIKIEYVDSCYCYKNGKCSGTKEMDECNCGGRESCCSFYEYVKKRGQEKIEEQKQEILARNLFSNSPALYTQSMFEYANLTENADKIFITKINTPQQIYYTSKIGFFQIGDNVIFKDVLPFFDSIEEVLKLEWIPVITKKEAEKELKCYIDTSDLKSLIENDDTRII